MRKELLTRYRNLTETFVDIDDEKTETLDKLLDIDRKLASGEIKKYASITRERKKLIKKYRAKKYCLKKYKQMLRVYCLLRRQ